MPAAVIAAVAGSFVAGAVSSSVAFGLAGAGIALGAELLIGTAVGAVAGGLTSGLIGGALRGAPSAPQSFTAEATARAQVVRSPVASRHVIYGRAKVSGPLVFAASSSDNSVLHLVIALAGHECTEIESVWFGDEEVGARDGSGNVTAGRFAGKARIVAHMGAADQTANADLIAADVGWTAAHRLRGVCYLYVRLAWDKDVYPRGIPNISAVVRGKRLYDPRTGYSIQSSNWALAVRDYLTSQHGLNASASEIDEASFIAAANIADESVSLAAGGAEPRYTANGIINLDTAPLSILESMLSAGAGSLVWQGGKYRLLAGAYVAPSFSFDEDILRGPVSVRPRVPRKELFNGVRGTYIDPAHYWQAGDFTPVKNATYAAQDGGEIMRDIALPWTTSAATAQRIAKIALERGRQGIVVEMPCKPQAFGVTVGSTINLTISHLGWANKVFRVVNWKLSDSGAVDLILNEESAAVYVWSAEETIVDPAPDTNLPDPFFAHTPTGVTLTSGTSELLIGGDGTVISRIKVTWDPIPDAFTRRVEVQYRVAGYWGWGEGPSVPPDGAAWIASVKDGATYEVRLRSENSIGVRSAWSATATHTVIGKTEPPATVPWLAINDRTLSWGTVSDADLAGYRLRWLPSGSSDWGQAQPMHAGLLTYNAFTPETLPSGDVSILIKAVDTSGNESISATAIVGSLPDPLIGNIIETVDLHGTGFPGLIGGGTVVSGDLLANAAGTMWNPNDRARMWNADANDPMWGLDYYAAMTYLATLTIPTAYAGAQITIARDITGEAASIDYRPTSGDASQMWGDAVTSMWSGDDAAPMRGNAPGYVPWPGAITAVPGDMQIRVRTNFSRTRGRIDALAIKYDVPDRSVTLNNVSVSPSGTTLSVGSGWHAIKTVNLTLQADSGAARVPIVINKSLSGPLVKCLDSSGAAVNGTVDAIVQGY
jgi:hypothetical protein